MMWPKRHEMKQTHRHHCKNSRQAAFTGLGLNVGETEALGSRIKKAVASEEAENAMKEYVQVSVDGMEVRGWMAPAKSRAELGIEQWNDEEAKVKMVIKLDDGE